MGYGPDSSFWNEYIDSNGQSLYSVSLASYTLNGTNPGNYTSNITLGAFGDFSYYNSTATVSNAVMPSLQLSTDVEASNTYSLSSLGFGIVY